MKVSDLLDKLSVLDKDLEVVLYSEDAEIAPQQNSFRLLGIVDVSTSNAEKVRLADGTPYLKFCKTDNSDEVALIEVTTTF